MLLGVSYQLACIALRRFSTRLRDLIFVAALLLTNTLMNKELLVVGDNVARNLPLVGQNLVYILPQGLAAILAAMFPGAGDRGGGGLSRRHLCGPDGA